MQKNWLLNYWSNYWFWNVHHPNDNIQLRISKYLSEILQKILNLYNVYKFKNTSDDKLEWISNLEFILHSLHICEVRSNMSRKSLQLCDVVVCITPPKQDQQENTTEKPPVGECYILYNNSDNIPIRPTSLALECTP